MRLVVRSRRTRGLLTLIRFLTVGATVVLAVCPEEGERRPAPASGPVEGRGGPSSD